MSESKKILATITTYNPDMELLERNIDAVINQVDELLVYENNSNNRAEIVDLCSKKNVKIILNEQNEGVAGPLHDGVIYADKNGYEYIFTLDQDSVISDGMVQKLANILDGNDKIAMICGTRVNPDFPEELPNEDYVAPIHAVITSGALSVVKAIMDVGNYVPEMFIDSVDLEMCCRLRKCGYEVYECGVRYLHFIGEPVKYRILFKKFITQNYSTFRLFYMFRNAYLIQKKYKKDVGAKQLKNYLLKMKIKIILVEKDKCKKLKAIRKGKKDAKAFYKQMKEKYSFL